MKKLLLIVFLLLISIVSYSQIRYYPNGKITTGNVSPFSFYTMTFFSNGTYFTNTNNRFFQIDATPQYTRIAGHGNCICFYNTQTATFNSVQVSALYYLGEFEDMESIQNLNIGSDIIRQLRPISFNFIGSQRRIAPHNIYTGNNAEFGLIAQEVEKVLPNLVVTNEDGVKLIDYVSLIPVLIDAVQTLQKEVDELKKGK